MIQIARWVSVFAHPFVTGTLMVAVSALRLSTPGEAARTVAAFVFFAVVPVALLTFRQVRRGAWENVDASNVNERPLLFMAGVVVTLALLGWFALVRPQPFLVRGILGVLGMILVSAATTGWVKLSLHVAFAALSATTLILLGSSVGWVLALVVPVLAWSRSALGRHTLLELALGALVGIATGLAIQFV